MRFVLPLILALLLAPTESFAQAPSQAQIDQAEAHFQIGAEWYTTGDYPKAIVEFLKGYNVVPNAMFLYNISLSYAKLGNNEDALMYAERAQGEVGMPDDVSARNSGRIGALRARLSGLAITKNMSELTVAEVIPVEPSGGSFGMLGISGIAIGAAGLGLIGGSVLIGAGVSDDITTLESEANGGDQARFDELKTNIESDQSLGKILLFSGAGLTAVGLTLVLVDLMNDEETVQTSLRVVPTPGGAGAVLNFMY